ncbi:MULTISPECIES: TonB-dependent receptor [Aliiglaciecola]|uniref:TonB-dependent receptor n=1 Tax=Aliiglaciecola TaxID=1406885 RepID=UPI001C0911EC|nr:MULTISPECIES: TonB-dependent receptor [Aliiglaciecola]MBU2876846.1 TonB-dependent receptor [Aliiglaciecola lipolytica]MDO6711949.1 TonB-dependent receptor [Aliiglaciecola sp. 2_MG-2023]MDO6753077.1 TonB-dependent receptor [Aliiglaciecola sp. 1_MG-2023]
MSNVVQRRFKRNPLALAVCTLLLNPMVGNSQLFAQEQPNIAEEEAVEQILVYARKRGEQEKDVPVSLTAMTGDELTQAGVSDITSLFALMPGVENNADGSRIANKPAIRGVGSTENSSIRAKVTTFIDGIPIVGAQGMSSFAGLQQVEVLRGPQSSAFGRSTFGGAINYVTRDPDPSGDLEFDVRGRLGTDETRDVSLSLITPLIEDKLAVAVTLESNNYGGPSEWVTTSGDQLGARKDSLGSVKLVYTPTDNIKAELMYLNQEIDDGHTAVLFANLDQLEPYALDSDGLCVINGGSNACVINGEIDHIEPYFDYNFDHAVNPVVNPGTRVDRERIQGSVEIEFDNGMALTVLGAVTDEVGDTSFDRDAYNDVTTIHVASSPESDETYAEVRLASSDEGDFNWLVGASLYEYDYLNTVYANKSTGAVMDLYSEGARNIGVFFNLGYQFTDRLTGSIEGRYQSDEIDSVYPENAARGVDSDIQSSSDTKSFQPRIALSYELDNNNNVYAQLARGTNPAGFNANALDPILLQTAAEEGFDLDAFQTYEEEVIVSYELGVKGYLPDHDFRYSLALYYLDWEGYVQPATANWTPSDGELSEGTTADDYYSRLFLNTGDLSGAGIEFEGEWQPIDYLDIGTAISYTGLEFKDDACSPIPLDYGVAATSTEPYNCAATIGGNAPPMLSRFTWSLNATYTVELNSDLVSYSRVDYQYRSKRYVEQINTDYLPAYSMVNLRSGIRADNWSIELYVNNLFDEDSPAGAVRFFDGRISGMSYNTSVRLREPRTAGINLAYSFF